MGKPASGRGSGVKSLPIQTCGSPKIRFIYRFRPVLTRTTSSIIGHQSAGGNCYCWLKTKEAEKEIEAEARVFGVSSGIAARVEEKPQSQFGNGGMGKKTGRVEGSRAEDCHWE